MLQQWYKVYWEIWTYYNSFICLFLGEYYWSYCVFVPQLPLSLFGDPDARIIAFVSPAIVEIGPTDMYQVESTCMERQDVGILHKIFHNCIAYWVRSYNGILLH